MTSSYKDSNGKEKEDSSRRAGGGYKGGGGRVETNHNVCPVCGGDIGDGGLGNHLNTVCPELNNNENN